jgi:hypothetical protein
LNILTLAVAAIKLAVQLQTGACPVAKGKGAFVVGGGSSLRSASGFQRNPAELNSNNNKKKLAVQIWALVIE